VAFVGVLFDFFLRLRVRGLDVATFVVVASFDAADAARALRFACLRLAAGGLRAAGAVRAAACAAPIRCGRCGRAGPLALFLSLTLSLFFDFPVDGASGCRSGSCGPRETLGELGLPIVFFVMTR
jgi:hypothetical protein